MVNAMNKLKRYFSLTLVLFIIISLSNIAQANSIDQIDTKATIHKDGSVTITEHRIFSADQGTEHYLTFGNLGESELLDFKVYEQGKELEDVGTWDVNASMQEKAGKYGVNTTSDGIELCFGIGSFGKKDFTIEYKFSNFVRDLEDGKQAVYWYFIQPGMDSISNINISVSNEIGFKYKFPDTKMWGFGYKGKTEIKDDELLLWTDNSFSSNEYIVLLSIFPENTFQTSSSYPYTEDGLKEMAMKGATSNDGSAGDADIGTGMPNSNSGITNSDEGFSSGASSGLLTAIISLVPIGLIISLISMFKGGKTERIGQHSSSKPRDFYYRDIPYNGNITDIGSLINANTNQYISTFILKWIKEGRLRDEKEMTGFIFKKETLALVINEHDNFSNESVAEEELWNMVKIASGKDNILSEKEFKKYMTRNIDEFNDWNDDLNENSKKVLLSNSYFEKVKKKFLFFSFLENKITDKGQELLDNITGFKNYLLDFSLVSEREMGDVKLWQEYMTWASMLGIAEEVYKQFKIVNPQITDSMIFDYQTVIMTNAFANSIYNTQSSLNSSSAFGGGGSSFGGGGGGASGGSFGGGTR